MRRRHVHRWGLMAGLIAVGGACGGCLVSTSPGLEVLAGRWELKTEATSDLSQLLLTFDRPGNVTDITYEVGNFTFRADFLTGSASVVGDQVTIVAGFLGNSFIFTGTLEASKTTIVGNVTTRITAGLVTVEIDNGPATLVKQ